MATEEQPKETHWQVYRQVLEQRRGLVALYIGCTVTLLACTFGLYAVVKILFDALTQQDARRAGYALIAILALIVTQNAVDEAGKHCDRSIVPATVIELDALALERGLQQAYAFYTDTPSGLLMAKVNKLGNAFERLFPLVSTWASLFMTLIVMGVVFLRQGIGIFLLAVAYILLVGWYVRRASEDLKPFDEGKTNTRTNAIATEADILANATTILLHAQQAEEVKRYRGVLKTYLDAWMMRAFANRRHWGTIVFLSLVFECAVLISLYLGWKAGQVSIGSFVVLQALTKQAVTEMSRFYLFSRQWQDAVVDAEEAMEILTRVPTVRDSHRARALDVSEGTIAFSSVSFAYPKSSGVLLKFTLIVKPGERIGLVGRSGAGKSTVTKLLLRCYDPIAGSIRIDGQDLRCVSQSSLRWSIAYVPQEPLLFCRTIRENIAYGRLDATEDEIVDAAKRAHCHAFILALPNGYDTVVGERGVRLSGGERQRVAIARAILKDAPILILDEATSSLDPENEQDIQAAMAEVMRDKTVIVIAHRLSTVRHLDRVIVMDRGSIVDEGTHDALLNRASIYRDFWERQTDSRSNANVPPKSQSCSTC